SLHNSIGASPYIPKVRYPSAQASSGHAAVLWVVRAIDRNKRVFGRCFISSEGRRAVCAAGATAPLLSARDGRLQERKLKLPQLICGLLRLWCERRDSAIGRVNDQRGARPNVKMR